jgi:hypothetical protein
MWSEDVRHGVGTLSSPGGGSIFVGTFQQDKRVGLGVTYWPGRGKKYVAEYVADAPSCGMMLPLDDDSVEAPAGQQLRNAIAAARIKAAAAAAPGACAAEMPELQLMQPSQVRLLLLDGAASGLLVGAPSSRVWSTHVTPSLTTKQHAVRVEGVLQAMAHQRDAKLHNTSSASYQTAPRL